MNKEPNEAYDFLKQLAKSSQARDSYEPKKNSLKGKQRTSAMAREKYILNNEHDLSARLTTLARRVKEIEVR